MLGAYTLQSEKDLSRILPSNRWRYAIALLRLK